MPAAIASLTPAGTVAAWTPAHSSPRRRRNSRRFRLQILALRADESALEARAAFLPTAQRPQRARPVETLNDAIIRVVRAPGVPVSADDVARRARAAALDRLLVDWDATLGPVSAVAAAAARAALNDLDAGAIAPAPPRRRRRGVA